jgi:hypothetical protein
MHLNQNETKRNNQLDIRTQILITVRGLWYSVQPPARAIDALIHTRSLDTSLDGNQETSQTTV